MYLSIHIKPRSLSALVRTACLSTQQGSLSFGGNRPPHQQYHQPSWNIQQQHYPNGRRNLTSISNTSYQQDIFRFEFESRRYYIHQLVQQKDKKSPRHLLIFVPKKTSHSRSCIMMETMERILFAPPRRR